MNGSLEKGMRTRKIPFASKVCRCDTMVEAADLMMNVCRGDCCCSSSGLHFPLTVIHPAAWFSFGNKDPPKTILISLD